jgi:hypothetical protein
LGGHDIAVVAPSSPKDICALELAATCDAPTPTKVYRDYRDTVKLVIEFKQSGLKPEVYSYLIVLTALVKEQKEFSKALRKLNSSVKDG